MSKLQKNMSPGEGARLLKRAHELGVDFLDTADLYDTYAHIKAALRDAPDFKISTKAYCYDEATAEAALTRAIRETGRERIDLFMLHEQESIHTLRGHEAALRYLNRQKEKGIIGAVGVSTHHVACVRAATWFGGIDVIHPIVNASGIGIADGTREEMEQACSVAHAAGIGILAMKPLGGGHLLHDAKAAVEYVLSRPWVDCVAIGMQSLDEVEANVALFEGREPDVDVQSRLAGQKRALLIHDWCEGCGKCVARCGQNALSIEAGRAQVDAARCVLCGYCATACRQFCIKVI